MTDQDTIDSFDRKANEITPSSDTESPNESAEEPSKFNHEKSQDYEIETKAESSSLTKSEDILPSSLDQDDDDDVEYDVDPDKFDIGCELAREYLAYRRTTSVTAKTLAENSVSTYESILREYCNFVAHFDHTVVDAPDSAINEYIKFSINLGRAASTVIGRVSILRGFYSYLNKGVRSDVDPTISVATFDQIEREAIKEATKETMTRDSLDYDEVENLFDNFNSDRDRLMCLVSVETGFRNSDICGILREDIDFDKQELTARAPKYGDPYTVPISDELALELAIYWHHKRESYNPSADNNYVFPSSKGGKISKSRFCDIVREAAKEAGIQYELGTTSYESQFLKQEKVDRTWHAVTPHTLRHTFITLLEEEGVKLEYRQLLANHESPKTTQRYSHGSKQTILKEAVDRLNFVY